MHPADGAILDEIIRREGSRFTNRPSDKGGPTKFGITIPALSEFLGRAASAEEVQRLDEETARVIYRTLYIERPRFDRIASDRLRWLLIDYGINSGRSRATRALQGAVGVAEDGIIGPATLDALARMDKTGRSARVYAEVMEHRLQNFVGAILNDPAVIAFRKRNPHTQLENMRGWLNRFAEFL